MNSGSALAAILSPVVAGVVTDWTGGIHNFPSSSPSVCSCSAPASAFLMHPERQFTEEYLPTPRPSQVAAGLKDAGIGISLYVPVHCGFRFARNDDTPSLKSALM
jgi:hypothetical protein